MKNLIRYRFRKFTSKDSYIWHISQPHDGCMQAAATVGRCITHCLQLTDDGSVCVCAASKIRGCSSVSSRLSPSPCCFSCAKMHAHLNINSTDAYFFRAVASPQPLRPSVCFDRAGVNVIAILHTVKRKKGQQRTASSDQRWSWGKHHQPARAFDV
jgi:hypothetical protein